MIFLFIGITIISLILTFNFRVKMKKVQKWKNDMNNRFDGIIDMEEERIKIEAEISKLKAQLKEETAKKQY